MNALTLLVDALATFRLTRLVTTDSLTEPLRRRVVAAAYRRDGRVLARGDSVREDMAMTEGPIPRLAELVTCAWCASIHTAAIVVALRSRAEGAWHPLSMVLALSATVGLAQWWDDT